MTRSQNKERKEKMRFGQIKKYRRSKLGAEKQKEHALQQQLGSHRKAIIRSKVMELQKKKLAQAEALRQQEANSDDDDDDDDMEDASDDDASSASGSIDDVFNGMQEETSLPAKTTKITPFTISGTRYKVVSPGVIVRETADLASPAVGRLATDTPLDVVEIEGRRGRIINPLVGWVSLEAQDRAMICQRDYEDWECDAEFDVANDDDNDELGAEDDEMSDDAIIVDRDGNICDKDGNLLDAADKKKEKKKPGKKARTPINRNRAADRMRKKEEKYGGKRK